MREILRNSYIIVTPITLYKILRNTSIILRHRYEIITESEVKSVNIYAKIQRLCKDQNKSIMGLEEELGFPRGSICKWDKNIPSVLKVKAVADALNTTVDELMKGD